MSEPCFWCGRPLRERFTVICVGPPPRSAEEWEHAASLPLHGPGNLIELHVCGVRCQDDIETMRKNNLLHAERTGTRPTFYDDIAQMARSRRPSIGSTT